MNTNQLRRPRERCAACWSITDIVVLHTFVVPGETIDAWLCLDYKACNRRWSTGRGR